MTYALVSLFLATGEMYFERSGLTLQECAGQAAKLRQESKAVAAAIAPTKGEVRYYCLPEAQSAGWWQ